MSEDKEPTPFVKPEVINYTMNNPVNCHECIVSDKVIDLNKTEYIRRELNGKLVFFHDICYKAWKKKEKNNANT